MGLSHIWLFVMVLVITIACHMSVTTHEHDTIKAGKWTCDQCRFRPDRCPRSCRPRSVRRRGRHGGRSKVHGKGCSKGHGCGHGHGGGLDGNDGGLGSGGGRAGCGIGSGRGVGGGIE
ncbi:hypothetical protein R6Q59_019248 [Mikania micrantha]